MRDDNNDSNEFAPRDLLTEVLGLLANIDRVMAPHKRRIGAAYRVDPLPPPPLPPTGPMGPDTAPRSIPRGIEAWRTDNNLGPQADRDRNVKPTLPHAKKDDPTAKPPQSEALAPLNNARNSSTQPGETLSDAPPPAPDLRQPSRQNKSDTLSEVTGVTSKTVERPIADPDDHRAETTIDPPKKPKEPVRNRVVPPQDPKPANAILPPPTSRRDDTVDPRILQTSHEGAPPLPDVLIPPQLPFAETQAPGPIFDGAPQRAAFGPLSAIPPQTETDAAPSDADPLPNAVVPVPAAKKPRRRQTAGDSVQLTKAEARRLSKRLQRSFLDRSLRRLT